MNVNTSTEQQGLGNELTSQETLRELIELSRQVSEIPKEEYWDWVDSPEGIEAMVNLLVGTYGEALKELEKH